MPTACPADAVGCSDTNPWVFGDLTVLVIPVVVLVVVAVALLVRAAARGRRRGSTPEQTPGA